MDMLALIDMPGFISKFKFKFSSIMKQLCNRSNFYDDIGKITLEIWHVSQLCTYNESFPHECKTKKNSVLKI